MRYILRFTIVLLCILAPHILEAQTAPSIEWQKCYGGDNIDLCSCISRTNDGGYILCGETNSHNGDVIGGHLGYYDEAWIVKIDSNGKLEWQKCIGGNNNDIANSIIQCFDKGYIVVGETSSHDGDIIRAKGDTGNTIVRWVAKLDSLGKMEWEKSLDGTVKPWFKGYAYSVLQNSDSSFIVAGQIDGSGEGLASHGLYDAYIAKLSLRGELLNQKVYGGKNDDWASSIIQTPDGGYIFAGATNSKNNGDVQGDTSSDKFNNWVVKLDPFLNIVWQKSIRGPGVFLSGSKIIRTKDDSYVLCSVMETSENDGYSYSDAGIIKIDTIGNLLWSRKYGGSKHDFGGDIQQTPDGNFIILGATQSNDRDVHGFHASLEGDDIWMLKLDSAGQVIWDECLGSAGDDVGNSVLVLSENEYIVAGSSTSKFPLVKGNHGVDDFYVAKLVSNPSGVNLSVVREEQKSIFKICPNPVIGKSVLQIENASEVKQTQYYDLLGREIFPYSYFDGNTLTIDTHLLPTVPFFAKINYLKTK